EMQRRSGVFFGSALDQEAQHLALAIGQCAEVRVDHPGRNLVLDGCGLEPFSRGVSHRGLHADHLQSQVADAERLAGKDGAARHARSIDDGAIAAVQVADQDNAAPIPDLGVSPRNAFVKELDGALGSTANDLLAGLDAPRPDLGRQTSDNQPQGPNHDRYPDNTWCYSFIYTKICDFAMRIL